MLDVVTNCKSVTNKKTKQTNSLFSTCMGP